MKKSLALLTIFAAISFGCDDGKKNGADALLTVLLANRPVPIVVDRVNTSMNSATTILVSIFSGQNCTGTQLLTSFPLTGVSQTSIEVQPGTTFSVQAVDQAGVETTMCENSPPASVIVSGYKAACGINSGSIACGMLNN
ncbi:hypothetical protein CH373_17845 [Leptospira perolatii]|uniref:Lipoprotein n=1 Tax=Leptospira perolatii TaxID=2023191 RepID=A0A2M9ZI46_9LEPT|nr:hypothetical protein [Leptospira perolatii]PJZ68020.1 hypothetical protein CH360_18390 [Leptospira perolatii]PJZ71735.1 hypothetical protein CH373_17845 [Leptospira perolatii]